MKLIKGLIFDKTGIAHHFAGDKELVSDMNVMDKNNFLKKHKRINNLMYINTKIIVLNKRKYN